jgi:Flp pilus assembly protein TadG
MLVMAWRFQVCLMRKLARDERGAAVVELALIAPVLALMLLLAVDVGLAVNEKMAVDHVMRVGAETAMADPGASKVQDVLEQTAGENFSVVMDSSSSSSYSMGSDGIAVGVSRFCACPNARSVAVACTSTCTGKTPLAFYRLDSRKEYSGIFLSSIKMKAALQVQVK